MVLFRSLLQNLLCEVVPYLRVIAQHFVVGEFQQLRATLTQSLADVLLYAWIVQFALTCWFPFQQLLNGVTRSSLCWPCSIVNRQHIRNLSAFQFVDCCKSGRIPPLQCRFGNESHIPGA